MKAKRGEPWAKVLEIAAMQGVEECVEWPFSRNKAGYGRSKDPNKGCVVLVNRAICEIVYGPPPTGRHEAAHLCNNPSCCAPAHLEWKTPKENNADKVANGTAPRGSKCGTSKLEDWQAVEIRERYAAGGVTQQELADEYGVALATINRLVRGEGWIESAGPITVDASLTRKAKGSAMANAKFEDFQIEEIRYAFVDGATLVELAEKYGVEVPTISQIVRGNTWKHVGGPITRLPRGARNAKGEKSGNAKLTMEKAREIRRLFNEGGISKAELARRFGVDATTIKSIIQGKTWKED